MENKRYFIFKDGEILGCSVDIEGAHKILLDQLTRSSGNFGIMYMSEEDYRRIGDFDYRCAESLRLTHDSEVLSTNQPLWSEEKIQKWYGKQPGTAKFEAKPVWFAIDDLFEVEGYSIGQTWNGWAVPYFTKSQVEKVKEALTKSGLTPWVRWKTEEDGTIVVQSTSPYDDEPDDIWSPQTIDGVDEPVWCIGGFAWVWEAFEHRRCETCGVDVPEDEHCGNDNPDGSAEYLCSDCFTPEEEEESIMDIVVNMKRLADEIMGGGL